MNHSSSFHHSILAASVTHRAHAFANICIIVLCVAETTHPNIKREKGSEGANDGRDVAGTPTFVMPTYTDETVLQIYIYIYRNVYLMETKFYDCVTMEIITITIVKIRLDRPSVPVRCSLIIILKPYRPYSLEPIPVAVSPAFGPWTENGNNNNNDNKGKSRRSAGHMFPIRKRIHTLFRCSLPWNWSARVCVGWLCTQQAGIVCCEP